MYFISGKYRESILEVYLKYTEIVQGMLHVVCACFSK